MRHRNMYQATGRPGWMRHAASPGWTGRSPSGLGPCAQYLVTGQWPGQAPETASLSPLPAEQQAALLEARAELLERQLSAVREQLAGVQRGS